MNTQTVHEAEVQRRHVRLQLPIKVQVQGVELEVIDWSNSGIAFNITALKAKKASVASGDVLDTTLMFDFDTFALSVPMSCEVRHVNADGSRAGCRFINMNQRNISIMQYMVSAYIAGDLVQVGDILDVASRNNFTNPRKLPSQNLTGGQRFIAGFRKLFYTTAVAAITLCLIGYTAMSIYERTYVIEARTAVLTADKDVLGERPAPVVFALMHYNDSIHLRTGMKVALGFPGYDQYYSGTIDEIELKNTENGETRVYITPDSELPESLLNSPVQVRVDTLKHGKRN